MSAIVKVEDLTYIYNQGMPDETVALDHVSFEIEEGEFVGVIGSTGCGKSTLITHFNGINKPTSGKVYIAGEDMWADPKDIRRFRFMTGLVFQYQSISFLKKRYIRTSLSAPRIWGFLRRRSTGACSVRPRSAALTAAFCSAAPLSFPAGRSAVWPLQVCLPWNRGFWCWTNPPPGWTRRAGI